MAKRGGLRWKSIGLKDEERLTAGWVHHRCPAWSADGKWLAFAAGDDHDATWVLTDRRGRVARTLAGPATGGAAFGPDGSFAFGRGDEIWMTGDPALPPVRLLGADGLVYREPAFSPDGRLLAFTAAERAGAVPHLYVLELASGQRHALFEEPTRADAHPAFSPDGEELFFQGTEGDDVAIHALRFANHALERISPMRVASRRPAPLSRELLVVERDTDGGSRLVLIDRRERRERMLSLDEAPGHKPGDKIALREPCVFQGRSGKVRLAFTQLVSDGDLRRFEICVARLKGVGAEEELEETPPPPPSNGEAVSV